MVSLAMQFELIKQRRTRRLTQAELAQAAGIHPVTLSRIETGRTTPDPSTRQRLADALGTTPAELFDPEADRRSA